MLTRRARLKRTLLKILGTSLCGECVLEGLGLIGKEALSALVLMGENGARKLTELVRYTPIKLGRGRRSTQSHVLIHEKFQFF